MDLKKLKVATAHMAGYTGVLGAVRFENGESVEWLPRHIRDRMAAAMPFVEIDQNGISQPAGAQYRMINEAQERAPVLVPLERQSETDKAAELARSQLDSQKLPELLTREQLEAIADKGGIKAVREVGIRWNAKHRSIAVLIEMILDAQKAYLAKRGISLEDYAAERAESTPPPADENADAVVSTEEPAPIDDEPLDVPSPANQAAIDKMNQKLAEAAASGDLGAALSAEDGTE